MMSTPLAAQLLADRNWTPIFLASSAILALDDRDTQAAAHYITELHCLPESRAKAMAIAQMRTALDRILAENPTLERRDVPWPDFEPQSGGLTMDLPADAIGAMVSVNGGDGKFYPARPTVPPLRAGIGVDLAPPRRRGWLRRWWDRHGPDNIRFGW
jgi:hypothetical protein